MTHTEASQNATGSLRDLPSITGHFGEYGGIYMPETLMPAVRELDAAYKKMRNDKRFQLELESLLREYVGRPTPLYFASRLSLEAGGAKIYLKREDLAHTGAHKINNALGQGLLAKAMGKSRIVAETGAGQHGVATATVCAMLNQDCVVYMGALDVERQALNVYRMQILGAQVVPVESGSRTLKDAINEAIRDWVTNVRNTYYLLGSVAGPHPYPLLVRDFQTVIGREVREQIMQAEGKLPDALVACVGGGSNAIGLFHEFLDNGQICLVGVEAAGHGINSDKHAATINEGSPGVLHGTRTYVLQDEHGQISEAHSISAGLDYPGVGPEHSNLHDTGRAQYVAVDDQDAITALQLLSRTEGIIPALESAHAIAYGLKLAASLEPEKIVVVNLSGRGDKDMDTVVSELGLRR